MMVKHLGNGTTCIVFAEGTQFDDDGNKVDEARIPTGWWDEATQSFGIEEDMVTIAIDGKIVSVPCSWLRATEATEFAN